MRKGDGCCFLFGDPGKMQENGGFERGFLLDMIKIIVGSERSERNGEKFKNGENYIRISLCAKPEVLKRAAEKIRNVILNVSLSS